MYKEGQVTANLICGFPLFEQVETNMIRNLQDFPDDDGNPAQISFGARVLLINEYRQLRVRAVQDCRTDYLKSKYSYPLKDPKNFNFGGQVIVPKTGSDLRSQPNPYLQVTPPILTKPAPPPAKEADKPASSNQPQLNQPIKSESLVQSGGIFNSFKQGTVEPQKPFSIPAANQQTNMFKSDVPAGTNASNISMAAQNSKPLYSQTTTFGFAGQDTSKPAIAKVDASPPVIEKVKDIDSLMDALKKDPKTQNILKDSATKDFLSCLKGIEGSLNKRLNSDWVYSCKKHSEAIKSTVGNLKMAPQPQAIEKDGRDTMEPLRQKFKMQADRLELSRSLMEIFENNDFSARTKNVRAIKVLQSLDQKAKSHNESIRVVQQGLHSLLHKLRSFSDLMKVCRGVNAPDASLLFGHALQKNQLIKIDTSIFGSSSSSSKPNSKPATNKQPEKLSKVQEFFAGKNHNPYFNMMVSDRPKQSDFLQSLRQMDRAKVFPGYVVPQNNQLRVAMSELLEDWRKESERKALEICLQIKNYNTANYASFDLNSLDSDEEDQPTSSIIKHKKKDTRRVNYSRQYMLQSKLKSSKVFLEHCTDYYKYKEIQERIAKSLGENAQPQVTAPKTAAASAPKPATAAPVAGGSAVLSGIFGSKKEEDPPELLELTQTISRIEKPVQSTTGDKKPPGLFGDKKEDKPSADSKPSGQTSLFSAAPKPQPTTTESKPSLFSSQPSTSLFGNNPSEKETNPPRTSQPLTQPKPADAPADTPLTSKHSKHLMPNQPKDETTKAPGVEEKSTKKLNSAGLITTNLFDSLAPSEEPKNQPVPSSSLFSAKPAEGQQQNNIFTKTTSATTAPISPNIFTSAPQQANPPGPVLPSKPLADTIKPTQTQSQVPQEDSKPSSLFPSLQTGQPATGSPATAGQPPNTTGILFAGSPTPSVFAQKPANTGPGLNLNQTSFAPLFSTQNNASTAGGFGQASSFSGINNAPKATMGSTGFGSASGFGGLQTGTTTAPQNLFLAAPTQPNASSWLNSLPPSQQPAPQTSTSNLYKSRTPSSDQH